MRNILPIILIISILIGISSAASPFAMNLVSNTIYQNTNSTPLSIYTITHSARLTGYLGNSTSLNEIIDLNGGSITITGVVYSLAGYNMSAYMLVEPNEYYKFNFTNATFTGQYSQKPSSSLTLIPQEIIDVSATNLYALLPFATGLLLGLLGVMMPWGWYRKSLFLIIGATILLIGGMLTIIPLPLAQVHNQAMNITTLSGNFVIGAYNSTISQPVLNESWGMIYEITYALLAVMFMILAVIFVLIGKRGERKR
jgi:hypothetical protein